MHALWGVIGYEYRMGIRRWGLWLAFALASIPSLVNQLSLLPEWLSEGTSNVWRLAGEGALNLNILIPVVAGIAMGDRLQRDLRLGTRELLLTTPLSRASYVLGKYLGAVAAALTPVLVLSLLIAMVSVAYGVSPALLGAALLAFVAVNVPAYLFIGAFALTCPLVMPLRVFQVLFAGYWIWANFVTPSFVPTTNGTLLMPLGVFAAGAFFGAEFSRGDPTYTILQAFGNLAVLGLCAALALGALSYYLAWQERRA